MGNLFGKPKVTRVTQQDRAVLQLKQQRDKLKQYQKKIQGVIEKDKELARRLIRDGNKDRAKLLLKKKRYQEQLLITTDGQLHNVEQLVSDLEFAQVELKVIESLKVGNESLKAVQKLFSIEDVEKIMDETREGLEKQREIDELLAGSLTPEDEAEVEEELEEIIRDSLPDLPAVDEPKQNQLDLTSVPDVEPSRPDKKTERVLLAA